MTGSELFSIRGQVGAPGFSSWIERHGRKLGLDVQILRQESTEVAVRITGPETLRDAMALGCSLGPWDVLVDDIGRSAC